MAPPPERKDAVDLGGVVINALTVVAATVVITWFLHGRFEGVEKQILRLDDRLESFRSELGGEIAAVRSELGGEIAAVRSELGGEIVSVRTELGLSIGSMRSELTAMRSDLTAVALALGARPRTAGGHG